METNTKLIKRTVKKKTLKTKAKAIIITTTITTIKTKIIRKEEKIIIMIKMIIIPQPFTQLKI